jgi:molybdate transport system substrate-binding protein
MRAPCSTSPSPALCGRRFIVALAVTVTLTLGAPAARAAAGEEVLIFAAASLKNALDEVMAGFAKQGRTTAKASYAASSALAKQVEQGAPAKLFLSADLDWMDYLDQRGLVVRESRANLLKNRLVLVAPKEGGAGPVEMRQGVDLAGLLGADGRLAVGEVKSVPAGKYAKSALERLGAWAPVEGRLAQAENVRAALTLVSHGEAPLGIVYQTDAAADPNVRIVGIFPEDSHPPIVYPVALTMDGSGSKGASDFLGYLKSSAARAAFERQGFVVLGAPAS